MELKGIRVALAQMNATVGALEENARRTAAYLEEARRLGADLVVFPELSVTGYPPEDLVFKPSFVQANLRWLDWIAERSRGITAVVGFIDPGHDLYNAAAVLHDGRMAAVYRKMYLPNYGVFDEHRYFEAGSRPLVFRLEGIPFGVTICEDIWYPGGPARLEALLGGAQVIVNLSASPYHAGKVADRERMLGTRASDHRLFLLYCNAAGGQDELVFDGHSTVFDESGRVVARAAGFREELLVVDIHPGRSFFRRLQDPRRRQERLDAERAGEVEVVDLGCSAVPPPEPGKGKPALPERPPVARLVAATTEGADEEEVYSALVLGIADYARKNGFRKVVLGMSGGVDSSLVAALAADALGPENVVGLAMPSRFSSPESLEDAQAVAANLGIQLHVISIEPAFEAYLQMLKPVFGDRPFDVAEENLQARIRGNLWMALSNKFGYLVLANSNKSEAAVGYGTLYGDMAGGFAPIKDVPKTLVYRLARWRNRFGRRLGEPGDPTQAPVIPARVLEKAPSAELRPGQKDTDSLPPYEVLDPILRLYVEEDLDGPSIVSLGYPAELVQRVLRLVAQSEYKRRQAPPGVKITARAFGRDWRMPVTNRYQGGF